MRLHNQQEKLEEENDSIVDYMWNEYELTYSYAAELRSEELTDISDIKKQINILKANIKSLVLLMSMLLKNIRSKRTIQLLKDTA